MVLVQCGMLSWRVTLKLYLLWTSWWSMLMILIYLCHLFRPWSHWRVQYNVFKWATENKMKIKLQKTNEIVFWRPNQKLVVHPLPLEHTEQVSNAKLLGVSLNEALCFDVHVSNILKICSQRFYLLKLLRDQCLPSHRLNTVFHALVMSRLLYMHYQHGEAFFHVNLLDKLIYHSIELISLSTDFWPLNFL